MDGNWTDSLFKQYPYLLALGPLLGFFLSYLKQNDKLHGLQLLFASLGAALVVLCAYGWAMGWQGVEWHQVPFAALVLVALSNLTATTKEHLESGGN